jgi:hypothetical protein
LNNPLPRFIDQKGDVLDTDTLNTLVSDAIWRAEHLEAYGVSPAIRTWAEVSVLEEELAKAHRATSSEGRIARRGAVQAALKSGDYARAQELADRFVAEKSAPKSLKEALSLIPEEDAQWMAKSFP